MKFEHSLGGAWKRFWLILSRDISIWWKPKHCVVSSGFCQEKFLATGHGSQTRVAVYHPVLFTHFEVTNQGGQHWRQPTLIQKLLLCGKFMFCFHGWFSISLTESCASPTEKWFLFLVMENLCSLLTCWQSVTEISHIYRYDKWCFSLHYLTFFSFYFTEWFVLVAYSFSQMDHSLL